MTVFPVGLHSERMAPEVLHNEGSICTREPKHRNLGAIMNQLMRCEFLSFVKSSLLFPCSCHILVMIEKLYPGIRYGVYSSGVIVWELATFCVPWSGLNPMQVVWE